VAHAAVQQERAVLERVDVPDRRVRHVHSLKGRVPSDHEMGVVELRACDGAIMTSSCRQYFNAAPGAFL
jgi:hypothetical protein